MQTRLLHRFPGFPSGAAAFLCLTVGLAVVVPTDARAREKEDSAGTILLAQAEGAGAEEAALSEDELDAAAADSASGPPPGVEVMRVRGRGIAAIETEIPASVTQFDAATIEALGAQDISDLSRVTPNVNIVQPGATQATFFIRGVGLSDFSSNAAGAVTIFQDDVSINAPAIQTGQLFDIEGVEIARGPRGTGPFRNASAGAIRVRSRRPTGNYSAQLRSSFGRYESNGNGKGVVPNALIQDYEGALEVPILEESLSSRFAFRLRDAEPYKTNGCGDGPPLGERLAKPRRIDFRSNQAFQAALASRSICGERGDGIWPASQVSQVPPGLPSEVGDEHNWAARGTLRFTPPESEWEFFANGHGSRLDQQATLGQVIGTTRILGGGQGTFGGPTAGEGGYIEPDQAEEFEVYCDRVPGTSRCNNEDQGLRLQRELARGRPLDIRPYRGDYNRVGQTTRDSFGAFVTAEGEWNDLDIFFLASYDEYERTNDQDLDFTPDLLFEQTDADEAWQTYEELRVGGELAAEPFEWELGGYHLQEQLEVEATTFLFVSNSGQYIDIDRDYTQDIQSFGIWGEFAWDFADDFTLEGGVRFNWEQKKFKFARGQFSPDAFTGERVRTAFGSTDQEETWQTPTGQIVLRYHIDDEVSAFAKYTRGFKAGHFNALAQEDFNKPPAREEYNDAWEAGLQGSWFDRRLSLLAAYFYYRYENYQVFLFTDSAEAAAPPVLEILNAKQAENFGIEIEGRVEPLRGWVPRFFEGLRLSGNFGWLHGEYIDFQTFRTFFFAGSGSVNVPIDFSGKQLQNAPEFKASGTAEWTFDLGRWGYLVPRYDVNWSDDVFFDPNEGRGSPGPLGEPLLTEFAIGQRHYFLHNLRLAYRTPTGNLEVAAWVRNLEDRVYRNFAFDVSTFNRLTIQFPGEPRSIGIDLTVTFQ